MIIVYSVILGLYTLMMLLLIIGFEIGIYRKEKKTKKQSISIIIPFHNELNNLPKLIESLNKLNYPSDKLEVFLVNDCSTDGSEIWLEENDQNFKFKHFIINLTKKVGKKTAIEKALIMVNYDRILTTDADCIHSHKWLNEVGKTPGKITLGITLKISHSFRLLHKFQECESMILGGITIGSASLNFPILASGANLSYSKKYFQKLAPYENNRHIASGDDMFLLSASVQQGKKIGVRVKRPVLTTVKNTWNDYLNQTTRWAAKTGNTKIPRLTAVAALTLISNLIWLSAIITWIVTKENIFLTLSLLKFIVDFLFLFLTSLIYKRLILIAYAPIIALFYPFYLIVLFFKVLGYKEKWSSND